MSQEHIELSIVKAAIRKHADDAEFFYAGGNAESEFYNEREWYRAIRSAILWGDLLKKLEKLDAETMTLRDLKAIKADLQRRLDAEQLGVKCHE